MGPRGAEVFLDGRLAGIAPVDFPLFTSPGLSHEVRVEDRDGQKASKKFEGQAGESIKIELMLEGALGTTAFPASGLTEANEPGDPAPEPARAKRNWVPAYILGGVTVAALGTSMVFRGLAGRSSNKRDDLGSGLSDDACADEASAPATCSEIDKYRGRANRQATVADATLIASAVLGGATLGYVFYTMGKKSSKEPSQAALAVERGGISLSFSGQF